MSAKCTHCSKPNARQACGHGCGTRYCGQNCASAHYVAHVASAVCIDAGMKRERDDEIKSVTLITSDGIETIVDWSIAQQMKTIANLVEDSGVDQPIPLPNILKRTLDVCLVIVDRIHTFRSVGTLRDILNGEDTALVVLALHYLDFDRQVEGIHILTKMVIVSNMLPTAGESTNQYRRRLNLPETGDFTWAEAREIKDTDGYTLNVRTMTVYSGKGVPGLLQLSNQLLRVHVFAAATDKQLIDLCKAHVRFFQVCMQERIHRARERLDEVPDVPDIEVLRAADSVPSGRMTVKSAEKYVRMPGINVRPDGSGTFDVDELLQAVLMRYGSIKAIKE